MGSVNNPIGGPPSGLPSRDPHDKLFIERIEEDKLAKRGRKGSPDEPPDEEWAILAYLLQMFKKITDFFSQTDTSQSIEKTAQKNLLALKNLLEVLKKEDRSQDLEFLNKLSNAWKNTLEDSIHFKKDETASRFKILIQNVQTYPKNQKHTFGYYLSESSNQKWIPFPYMELVQKIHAEHEKDPVSSSLTAWTTIIEELANILKPYRS